MGTALARSFGMRVLVVYGSRAGGTRGIARTVAATLVESGHRAEARAACEVDTLDAYDAVIVGGAVYRGAWHADARQFVQHHADQLRTMPVFFFSSGPLDDSAMRVTIPPTRDVKRLMDLVSARAHVTFGGRLCKDTSGVLAQELVRSGRAGDWRDIVHIDSWTRWVASMLDTLPLPVPARARWQKRHRARQTAATLTFFTGATAAFGGLELIVWQHGAAWLPDISLLAGTPFSSFLLPGLLLLGIVGVANLVATTLMVRRHLREHWAVAAAGSLLVAYIATEMILTSTVHWLHLVYLAIGLATLATGLWLRFEPLRSGRRRPRGSARLARTV